MASEIETALGIFEDRLAIEVGAHAYLADGIDKWHSLDVDYHAPRVERLWREFECNGKVYRGYLHCIHPCKPEEALFHPHGWPSAMQIVEGHYVMWMGYGAGAEPPAVTSRFELEVHNTAKYDSDGHFIDGNLPFHRYTMEHPDLWHLVAPVPLHSHSPVCAYTIMVTGAPWKRWSPKADRVLKTLSPERKLDLYEMFRSFRAGFNRGF